MQGPIEAFEGELADGGLARFLKAADQASLYGVVHISGETSAILVLASGRLVVTPTLDGTPTGSGREAMVDLLCDLLANKEGSYRCAPLVEAPDADKLESVPTANILMESMIRRVSTSRARPAAGEPDKSADRGPAEPVPSRKFPPPPVIPTPAVVSELVAEPPDLGQNRRADDRQPTVAKPLSADVRQRRAADLRLSLRSAEVNPALTADGEPGIRLAGDGQNPPPPQPDAEAEVQHPPSRRKALRNLIRTLTS